MEKENRVFKRSPLELMVPGAIAREMTSETDMPSRLRKYLIAQDKILTVAMYSSALYGIYKTIEHFS